ncbi:MAG: LacI family transcriptional regulator [Verrucomicrobia bacterium]|nr:LacI family transcriptional regulator [Verrucomicrobiota bacterium]
MVRLKDIADRARVSVMTVSRVLRDAPDISAATKSRVQTIARELGYVPNAMAAGLRTRHSRLWGVVLPTCADPILNRALWSLETQAQEAGYDLLVAQSLHRADREENCIRRLLARRVEGLFVAPVYRLGAEAPIYAELARQGTKVVILGLTAPFCRPFTQVACDDVAGSRQVVRHLLELGHVRIAFLAGPNAAPSAQRRLEGYRRALRDAGLEPDDRLVFAAGYELEDGAKAAAQLLSEGAGATAVQAVNDLVAIGAAEVLLRQGLRIPADLSLAGFGNLPVGERFRIPLTTVRQPKRRLGAVAAAAMLALRRGLAPEVPLLPTELLVRASTGPPPGVPDPTAVRTAGAAAAGAGG